MRLSLLRRLAVPALLAVFACLLAGCWNPFAPPGGEGGGGGTADFKVRTSPANVLHNIETAYEYRNAGEYLDCLSEDFIFYPSDEDVQDPDLNIPPEWEKAEETTMHTNMFDDGSDVESIALTLTDSNITYDEGDPSDPDDDTYIYEEDVDLRVNLSGGLILLASTPSEYHFRVDIDQTGPNGERLWEIYKWFDLGRVDKVAHDPDVERMSLTRLKARFGEW
jgi:hypothetical protein